MQLIRVDHDLIVQFVVDGFENHIYSSQDEAIKKITYSGKKKKHTFTQLIFVTVNGWISNLSHSYPGSMNDISLSKFPECFMTKHLLSGCSIIGDKGFRGLNSYDIRTIDCINPANDLPFKRVRAVVENVILKIRKWKIVNDRIKSSVSNLEKAQKEHNKMIAAICTLVNLFDSPLQKY